MKTRRAVVLVCLAIGAYWMTRACESDRARSGRVGPYAVTVRSETEQMLAAARERTTFKRVPQDIRRLLDPVWEFIRANPGLRTDGHNVAMYWSEAGGGDVEVGVQVVRRFEETAAVVNATTPSGMVAATVHVGPYQEIGRAHDAVRTWCKENGYERAGPFWEVYGDWTDDPAQLRTAVFYLLK